MRTSKRRKNTYYIWGSGSRIMTWTIFVGHLYFTVGKKWVPNKTKVYTIENILDSPNSFIWSVFILQPTGTEWATAGEGITFSKCKSNIYKIKRSKWIRLCPSSQGLWWHTEEGHGTLYPKCSHSNQPNYFLTRDLETNVGLLARGMVLQLNKASTHILQVNVYDSISTEFKAKVMMKSTSRSSPQCQSHLIEKPSQFSIK